MIKKFSIGILALTSLMIVSCKKYEEGPGFSLKSKKERASNSWVVSSAKDISDGSNTTADYAGEIFELTKDGDYFENGSKKGTWEFTDNKEKITITETDGSIDVLTILELKENSMTVILNNDEEINFTPAD